MRTAAAMMLRADDTAMGEASTSFIRKPPVLQRRAAPTRRRVPYMVGKGILKGSLIPCLLKKNNRYERFMVKLHEPSPVKNLGCMVHM
jgi:hypothetical protein